MRMPWVLDVTASRLPPSPPTLAPVLLVLGQLPLQGAFQARAATGGWGLAFSVGVGEMEGDPCSRKGVPRPGGHRNDRQPSCFGCFPPCWGGSSTKAEPILVWLPSGSPGLLVVPGAPQALMSMDWWWMEVHSGHSVKLFSPPALLSATAVEPLPQGGGGSLEVSAGSRSAHVTCLTPSPFPAEAWGGSPVV